LIFLGFGAPKSARTRSALDTSSDSKSVIAES